jgi:nucleoside phosphorylase
VWTSLQIAFQILTAPVTARLRFINGQLLINGVAAENNKGLPDEALTYRIQYLVQDTGIRGSALEVAAKWEELLAGERDITPRELIETTRASSILKSTSEAVPNWWLDEMRSRLRLARSRGAVTETVTAAMLERWPHLLLHDPSWANVESPLPDMEPLRLERVWTELGLLPGILQPRTFGGLDLRSVREPSDDYTYRDDHWDAEPINVVLERLRQSLLIVARPGAGKTTLLKWVARYLIMKPESRFKFPMFISLRNYALRKRQKTALSIIDFFCQTCGLDDEAQLSTWRGILSSWADPALELSDLRNTTLLLLDGWDEVPLDDREVVRQAIEDVMNICPAVISSRPSGFPASLGTEQICYIAGLSSEGIDQLIHNYFAEMNAKGQEDLVRIHLDNHPDLWHLARNPFLLTLLSAISLRNRNPGRIRLPTTRFQLYRQTVDAIYKHHNHRYPQAPFSPLRQRQVQRLALWLMEDAPSAPTYLFTDEDAFRATDDATWFESVLSRSRLVTASPEDEQVFRFMHATFQEFMAAQALLTGKKEEIAARVQKRVYDTTWLEVMRFASGLAKSDIAQTFWRQLSEVARHPDRFGFIYARLARFVAEAGVKDGGQQLLGLDLRDKLWKSITEGEAADNDSVIGALLELDSKYCAERVNAELEKADLRQQNIMVSILARSPRRLVSPMIFKLIASGDDRLTPETRDSIIENAAGALAEPERARLRALAGDKSLATDERVNVISVLGAARDYPSVPILEEVAREALKENSPPEIAQAATEAIGRISGAAAANALIKLWEEGAGKTKGSFPAEGILYALGLTDDSRARGFFLRELSVRSPNDPLILPILQSLWGVSFWRGGTVIAHLLECSDQAEVRVAAAHALTECSDPFVSGALHRAARDDPDQDVKMAAMEALLNWVEPSDLQWLLQCCAKGEEQSIALQMLIVLSHRFSEGAQGEEIQEAAVRATLSALRRPHGTQARTAALYAYLLGPAVADWLLAVLQSPTAEMAVRQNACISLSNLKYEKATEYLLSLLSKYPDVDSRVRHFDDKSEASIVPEAAKALAQIDPRLLLKMKGRAAQQALGWFSASTGHLVLNNKIIDPAGRTLGQRKPHQTEGDSMTIQNADVAIIIALKEEFDVLFHHIRDSYTVVMDEETGRSFYAFQRPGPEGSAAYNCVAVIAGEMGPEVASLVTRRLISASNPSTVINMGICAGRRSDVKVGDIVIATQVKLYAHAVKVHDTSFKPAGRDFDTSQDLVRKLENLSFTHKDFYQQWKQGCRRRFGRIRPTEKRLGLIKSGLLQPQAKEVPGILASGPFVNQSIEFFQWILDQNRKVIAMEMEAGGMMTAIRERVDPTRSLILRAVSDYGDKSKKKLDKVGDGALRKYAMQNAISLLWVAMEAGLLPRTHSAVP